MPPTWFTEVLRSELAALLALSDEQIRQLYLHYELLIRWNDKIALTSLEPGSEMVRRHYCESLFLAAKLPDLRESGTLADIGSGGGFPGVPLAVVRPGWRVTLVESNQRKAVFLREAARHLGNVAVSPVRAEDSNESFDWIVSRGVRARDVTSFLPRIASRVGLLLGVSGRAEAENQKSIAWSNPIQLPWGDRRICIFGEVPRGTFHVEQ